MRNRDSRETNSAAGGPSASHTTANNEVDVLSARKNYRASILSGTRWTAAQQVGSQVVQMGVMVILARLLAPEDFGLLAMAMAVTRFLEVFKTLGTRAAIIQRKDLSRELLSSLFFLNCFFGILLSTLVAVAAPGVAWLYGDPRVGNILRVVGITFAITSSGLVHMALLNRAMRFERLAIIGWIETLSSGAVSISLAYAGWGVWALVAGNIARAVANTVMAWVFSPWCPRLCFHWSEVTKVARFSLFLSAYDVYLYFSRNVIIFVIGRFLGATPLGYYSIATRLFKYPLDLIMGSLRTVLFPALSSIQDDPALIRRTYLRACGGISLLILPMMAGACALASPFTLVVLGEQWIPAIPLILILAAVAPLNGLSSTVGILYMVKGRTDWLFYWQLANGTLRVLASIAGLPWGILGVTAGYGMASLVLAYPAFAIPFRLVGLKVSGLLRALAPYLGVTAAMMFLVLVTRALLEHYGFSSLWVLSVGVTVGVIAYSALILLTAPPALKDFSGFLPFRRFLDRDARV